MTVELGQITLVAALLTAISLGLFPLIGTYTGNKRMIALLSSTYICCQSGLSCQSASGKLTRRNRQGTYPCAGSNQVSTSPGLTR